MSKDVKNVKNFNYYDFIKVEKCFPNFSDVIGNILLNHKPEKFTVEDNGFAVIKVNVSDEEKRTLLSHIPPRAYDVIHGLYNIYFKYKDIYAMNGRLVKIDVDYNTNSNHVTLEFNQSSIISFKDLDNKFNR